MDPRRRVLAPPPGQDLGRGAATTQGRCVVAVGREDVIVFVDVKRDAGISGECSGERDESQWEARAQVCAFNMWLTVVVMRVSDSCQMGWSWMSGCRSSPLLGLERMCLNCWRRGHPT